MADSNEGNPDTQLKSLDAIIEKNYLGMIWKILKNLLRPTPMGNDNYDSERHHRDIQKEVNK